MSVITGSDEEEVLERIVDMKYVGMLFKSEKPYEYDDKGNFYVTGIFSDGNVDLDDQIVDPDAMREMIKSWPGTVKVQHDQRSAVGRKVSVWEKPNGTFWAKVLIDDPVVIKKIKDGVLRGFSVGIARAHIVRDRVAKMGRIIGGFLRELSVVDLPANPRAALCVAKMRKDGTLDESQVYNEVNMVKFYIDEFDIACGLVSPDLIKRKMDPNVGGGVDRDKIPDEDFAGPHRSFPIVAQGDVSDALQSLGRAGGKKMPKEEKHSLIQRIKEKILAIAHRKGFTVPESSEEEEGNTKEKSMTTHVDDSELDGPILGAAQTTEAVIDKAATPDVDHQDPVVQHVDMSHVAVAPRIFPGGSLQTDAEKLLDEPILTKAPSDDDDDDDDTPSDDDAQGANGDEGQTDEEKAAKKPDGEKPDGDGDGEKPEEKEPDSDSDSDEVDKAASVESFVAKSANGDKKVSVTYAIRKLHDMTCPAYRWDDVQKNYALKSFHDGMGLISLTKILAHKTTQKADGEQLAFLGELTGKTMSVNRNKEDSLIAAHGELHNAFKAANDLDDAWLAPVDGGPLPRSDAVQPAAFRRPYIDAGHARQNMQGHGIQGLQGVPPQGHSLDAVDFSRPELGETDMDHASTSAGGPTRKGLITVSKNMEAIHDLIQQHDAISARFPHMCTMDPIGGIIDRTTLPASLMSGDQGPMHLPEAPALSFSNAEKGNSMEPDVMKGLISKALTSVVTPLQEKISALEELVEKIASEPDPRVKAPVRGAMGPDMTTKAVKKGLTKTDEETINFLLEEARTNTNRVDQQRSIEQILEIQRRAHE